MPRHIDALFISPFHEEAEMYTVFLQRHGFQVRLYDDPEDGCRSAAQQPPDIVITRLRQKAHISGIDVVARLKASPLTRDLPVVVITTSIQASHREAAVAAGCDGYVLLPSSPTALAALLRRLVRTSSTQPPE